MLSGFSATRFFLQVSMTRRCHNHRQQTKPWQHEKGTQNTDNINTKKGTRNQITKQESPPPKKKGKKGEKKQRELQQMIFLPSTQHFSVS